jgi:transcriptional regulator with XRE-family HTH domain
MKSTYTEAYQKLLVEIVAARKASGMTQAELAAGLGRPQSYVSKIETGERRVDVVELVEIAKRINLDVSSVLERLKG